MSAGRLCLEALRFDFESPAELRRRVDAALRLDVGGFILFGADADAARLLVAEIRTSAGRPLWIAADLERGAGQHLRGLTTFPPPAALASHPDPLGAVRTAARTTALEARHLGINLVLAPVLDLDVEPRNPIVGTRSFGPDPDAVAALGRAWIETCQAEGVAACAKHFPGHGRTTTDSHAELPVVDAPRETLEADLAPFRAVAGEAACVMTAHVAYPALGGSGPATLEPAILRDLLREELGFRGLVVTDALNMSGARETVEPGLAPEVAALEAGCDLLLYPPDLAQAIASVERAAEASEAVGYRLARSLGRATAALARFPGAAPGQTELPQDLGARALAVSVESVSAPEGPLPEWLHPAEPVRVATVWDDREDPARPPFGALFRRTLEDAGWTVVPAGPADPDVPIVLLVASTPQAWKGTADLTPTARAALEGILSGGRALPILFGHPRLLAELGTPGLCAWATEPEMEAAAARRLDQLARSGLGSA